jgi:hypothetical protein
MSRGFRRGQVFSDNTVRQPRPTNPSPASLGHPAGIKNQIEMPPIMVIINSANHFAPNEIHLFSSQLCNTGPKTSLFSNHWCIRGEDLAKQAAASNTNGVVGNSGSTTPVPPSNRHSRPNSVQKFKSRFQNLLHNP